MSSLVSLSLGLSIGVGVCSKTSLSIVSPICSASALGDSGGSAAVGTIGDSRGTAAVATVPPSSRRRRHFLRSCSFSSFFLCCASLSVALCDASFLSYHNSPHLCPNSISAVLVIVFHSFLLVHLSIRLLHSIPTTSHMGSSHIETSSTLALLLLPSLL